MPKIELHCHLDGALDPELAADLLRDRGESYSEEELERMLAVKPSCRDLAEYLACFELPIRLLQTEYALAEQAFRLGKRCAEEGIVYLEVRFAPTSHLREGLKIRPAVEAVLKGLARAEKETGLRTGLLLCAMRHLPLEESLPLLSLAAEMREEGVAGIDLAGDEAGFPLAVYADFFRKARDQGIPFTIHAGETPGSRQNLHLAAELGAGRVGHGIDMRTDERLMRLFAEKRIAAELCPTSNLETCGIRELSEFPLRVFMEQGIPVSLNTDNRTISSTSLTGEYERLDRERQFTEEELRQIYEDSVEAAFAGDEVKEELLKKWQNQ